MKLFAERLRTFPSPRLLGAEDILAMSDDLSVERLLEAYSFGIFPWPHEALPTLWYCPAERGVLDFSEFHIPRSLQKFLRTCTFTFSLNREFKRVLEGCAQAPRPHQNGTWITNTLMRAYLEFYHAGYAHSLEVWDGEDLVGGLYGVYVAGVFCGESMFFLKPNASKFALVKMVEFLEAKGLSWMDIQMVSPLLELMGGKYISREQFLRQLDQAKTAAFPIEFRI